MLVGKGVAVVIAFRDGAAERRERGEKKGVEEAASSIPVIRRTTVLRHGSTVLVCSSYDGRERVAHKVWSGTGTHWGAGYNTSTRAKVEEKKEDEPAADERPASQLPLGQKTFTTTRCFRWGLESSVRSHRVQD